MIYLLYYEINGGEGDREEWNVFYTPVEAFSDSATRTKRKDFILSRVSVNDRVEFNEVEVEVSKSYNRPIEEFA